MDEDKDYVEIQINIDGCGDERGDAICKKCR
jgi:hypothetical protein